MFQPRAPLEYKPPVKPLEFDKPSHITGVADFMSLLATPPVPKPAAAPTAESVRTRKRELAKEANDAKLEERKAAWNPSSDPNATGDAFATLFVGRLAYETTEKKLVKEFEEFGRIKRAHIVKDKDGRSRGYGFIEFEKDSDVKVAFSRGDGKRIDGRRILCDVERGRTVPGWVPRKLGGGLGNSRASRPSKAALKDDRVYPPIGEYAVIVPAELEDVTNQDAVTARHLAAKRKKVQAAMETMHAIANGLPMPSAAAPAAAAASSSYRGSMSGGYGGAAASSSSYRSGLGYDRDRDRGDRDRSERGGDRDRDRDSYRDRDRERDRERDRDRDSRRRSRSRSRSRSRDRRDRDRDRDRSDRYGSSSSSRRDRSTSRGRY
jgi:U1 small nuclear ribonucleoprotein